MLQIPFPLDANKPTNTKFEKLMKSQSFLLICIFILTITAVSFGQDPHNVYSFSYKNLNNEITFSNPKFLTGYNAKGYNNQPYFIGARTIYLSSMISGQNQTDIYALNLFNSKKYQVIKTPEAEYSPQLRPGTGSFTCVRVESDGVTQRLWQFPKSHSTQGKPLFPNVKNVGYYYWLDENIVAMFLVGEPHSLVIGDARDNSIEQITSNIGRGMGMTPDGTLLFIQKLSENTWYIKELDIETKKTSIVIETLRGAEDFIVMSDGSILMASQASIYRYEPNGSREWKPVADMRKYGLKNITRMAFNQNRTLVLVD